MALPKKLKDFNLFADGNNWQGLIPSLTLPELARNMVEYRGGGMDGAVKLDFGQNAIAFTYTAGGFIREIFAGYGAVTVDERMLRWTGAYESDDTGEVLPVEIVARGRAETINMGDIAAGEDNEIEVTMACTYYKLTVNGEVLVEIDIPHYVFNRLGVDLLAQRRAALGV